MTGDLLVTDAKDWELEKETTFAFYNHFWPFFCQLHLYYSQNLGADGHFKHRIAYRSLFSTSMYSQVPIKRVGPNKRVGWIF